MDIFGMSKGSTSNAADKPAPKDYGPAFAVMVAALDDVKAQLEEMNGRLAKAPEVKQQIITLSANVSYSYDDFGYKYWGLFAAAAVVLTVTAYGIQYPLNVAQGFNKVVLPGGATLTAAADVSLLAVWSDHLEI